MTRRVRPSFGLITCLALLSAPSFAASNPPWAQTCSQFARPYRYGGIYPSAMDALRDLAVLHRIVRGIDAAGSTHHPHDMDAQLGDRKYTAAIDLSVKCLAPQDVKGFLSALADAGFAAWYRAPGADGWPVGELLGEPVRAHIHAVWVGERLKSTLQTEVADWLAGQNGLKDHAPYAFWQPSEAQRSAIKSRFEAANGDGGGFSDQSALAALGL